jgi:hypothetical protein
VFTAQYGLIPYTKQIVFRLLKVKGYSSDENIPKKISSFMLNRIEVEQTF